MLYVHWRLKTNGCKQTRVGYLHSERTLYVAFTLKIRLQQVYSINAESLLPVVITILHRL